MYEGVPPHRLTPIIRLLGAVEDVDVDLQCFFLSWGRVPRHACTLCGASTRIFWTDHMVGKARNECSGGLNRSNPKRCPKKWELSGVSFALMSFSCFNLIIYYNVFQHNFIFRRKPHWGQAHGSGYCCIDDVWNFVWYVAKCEIWSHWTLKNAQISPMWGE